MNSVCLFGNGASIAYNQALAVDRLTTDLLGLFNERGASAAESALRQFARRLTPDSPDGFETLLGPLSAVADALAALPDVCALAGAASADVETALGTVRNFLEQVNRHGMATTLGHIAARTIGGDYHRAASPIAAALIGLGTAHELTVGTLNYDGLLLSALMDGGTDFWGQRAYDIADLADGRASESHEVVPGYHCEGHPLRNQDSLPGDRAALIQLHGSLGWLRHPDDPEEIWKFSIGRLREIEYWDAWRDGRTDWAPAVILTDQKERAIASWPFTLAYDAFARRLVTADRWLIAGYGLGDVPVNRLYGDAMSDRQTLGMSPAPPTMIISRGGRDSDLRARAAEVLAIPSSSVYASTAGMPDAFTSPGWTTWSQAGAWKRAPRPPER